MSKFSFSKPESFKFQTRTVGILAFPGVEILDITGPSEVFGFANEFIKYHGLSDQDIYSTKVFAEKHGPVKTLSSIQIIADEAYGDTDVVLDTLIFPGAFLDKVERAMADKKLVDWIKAMAPKVRRVVSVCTGSFFLAEAGLLDGCKATTHWNWSSELSKKYPKVCVEPDHIFIKDGNIFTSGGITSGIDLTLALVEEDWGRELAVNVARFMVVFLKRPGGQSQFSAYLANEAADRSDIRDLQGWIMDHAAEDLTVEMLAERMAMSPRNFARLFSNETGMTPAKYVEMVRIDQARNLLETSDWCVEAVATETGFKDPERMRRAFLRQLGVNPQDYRRRFSRAAVA